MFGRGRLWALHIDFKCGDWHRDAVDASSACVGIEHHDAPENCTYPHLPARHHVSTQPASPWSDSGLKRCSGFIASCIRLSLIFQTNAMTDTRYTAVVWTIWTVTEPANYVIAACLPTLRPVLTRVLPEKMFVFSKSRDTSNKPYTSRSLKVSWRKGHVAPKLELIWRDMKSHMTGPWDPARADNSRSHIVGDDYMMQSIHEDKGKGVMIRTQEV